MEPCTQSPGSLSGFGPEERSKRDVCTRTDRTEFPPGLRAMRAADADAARERSQRGIMTERRAGLPLSLSGCRRQER